MRFSDRNFRYFRFINLNMLAANASFRHHQPVHDRCRKLFQLDTLVRGAVRVQLCQSPCVLAHRTFIISVEKMVKSDGNLNQPLEETPVGSACTMPKILKGIVTFEIATAVEFIDATLELIPKTHDSTVYGKDGNFSSRILNVEISRFGMVHDNCRRGLFRYELVLLGKRNANTLRLQQLKKLRLIFETGASRITEAVPRALIMLTEQF